MRKLKSYKELNKLLKIRREAKRQKKEKIKKGK